jgi:hypothetical protein
VTHRLTKRDVEALLSSYDDDPVAALERALQRLLDDRASFDELVDRLTRAGDVTAAQRQALLARDVAALDALAAELNERRTLRS